MRDAGQLVRHALLRIVYGTSHNAACHITALLVFRDAASLMLGLATRVLVHLLQLTKTLVIMCISPSRALLRARLARRLVHLHRHSILVLQLLTLLHGVALILDHDR